MIKIINFVKMHGLGNDFVILNQQDLKDIKNISNLVIDISNRQIGIGADQIIIYEAQSAHYNMFIYNTDGSSAANCGNAARCLAKLMFTKSNVREITLALKDRSLKCKILANGEISVNMGTIKFEADWMPDLMSLQEFAERYMLDPQDIICADAGNPHLIIFSNINPQDQGVIGSQLQKESIFPNGVNVNFAIIKDNKIYLKVWERGTGFTLACGSGACATYAAARHYGFVNNPAEVVFGLGKLKMHDDNSEVTMTGPATLVAEGKYYLDS